MRQILKLVLQTLGNVFSLILQLAQIEYALVIRLLSLSFMLPDHTLVPLHDRVCQNNLPTRVTGVTLDRILQHPLLLLTLLDLIPVDEHQKEQRDEDKDEREGDQNELGVEGDFCVEDLHADLFGAEVGFEVSDAELGERVLLETRRNSSL